jgi:hypothetical protein
VESELRGQKFNAALEKVNKAHAKTLKKLAE